ncbi:probable receptor-like protein kinase At2g23200 [Rutidosis leptorrhynchoides]|uniref:probable receptor-like protein kinase At2g23200 n=1 Tax=Rutidosis leptorrhynchoides TaxID=125765 RepID=UPI003A9A23A4
MTYDEYVASTMIPFVEIEAATNDSAAENMISQGICKGQLSVSGDVINIVARICPPSCVAIEMLISYGSNHKNICSAFKHSQTVVIIPIAILISKYVANGSLNKYLSDSQTLTWMQRLRICVGVAHALSHLHNDILRDDCIIHGSIKSSKILLDDHWEPKLCDFKYSMVVKKGDVHRPREYWDQSGYRDPEYNETKSLSHKSDVFSFGVVLFEVLFGSEASTYFQPNEDQDAYWYLARLARQHYEEKRLDDMIDSDLQKQMSLQSMTIFSETAYFCLKEVRAERPDINQVVRKLEKALQLQQKHDQNQEHLTDTAVESRISRHLKAGARL